VEGEVEQAAHGAQLTSGAGRRRIGAQAVGPQERAGCGPLAAAAGGQAMDNPADPPAGASMDYSRYQTLAITRRGPDDSVLDIRMRAANGKLPTAGHEGHRELAAVWHDVSADDSVRVAVLRGEGQGFSGGGDLSLVQDMAADFETRSRVWKEARDLVYNVINCDKPIVSALHGPAVGAGLVAGLLADIPIAAKTARIVDGHTRLGVAAGDHAAIVWPLLCGLAKAKYYLMLCEPLSGAEAERIGLVALAVEEDQLLPKSYEVADRLAQGSQSALRWTKYSLNNWLRQAGPTFDTSLALEFMGFAGPDVREGVASLRERRAPKFGA
jgi:enoyl-CoA hydratase